MALRQPPLSSNLKIAWDHVLAVQNGERENWKWDEQSRAVWELADEDWQQFKTKWYGSTGDVLSLEHLPLSITGGLSSILVREAYVTMFDHVWAWALSSRGHNGVIITGQPGTGRTVFQLYLLIRLLQLKQVILLTLDGVSLYLFYDQVYLLDWRRSLPPLPQPRPQFSDVFIWSLIDIGDKRQPNRVLVSQPCFPVQTASPSRERYTDWNKYRSGSPLLTGLPLWSYDELERGLSLQPRYQALMDAICKYCDVTKQSSDIEYYPGVREVLDEREKSLYYKEHDDAVLPSPVMYVLQAAINHFGYSPRDVFRAMFDFGRVTMEHQAASDITYQELYDSASLLTGNFTKTNRIIALSPVFPVSGPFGEVTWTADFKSKWIASNVLRKLSSVEQREIRRKFDIHQHVPGL